MVNVNTFNILILLSPFDSTPWDFVATKLNFNQVLRLAFILFKQPWWNKEWR